MGGSTSRPLQCVHGCWSSKSPLSDRELCACHWEEIPTPSVCEHRDTPVEGPPSQEKLIQVIETIIFVSLHLLSEQTPVNQVPKCRPKTSLTGPL
ncbi:unnamed protein product [Haemonchus placei]|uniref:Uncharacterized protein n=1 Tax=Haemonchus placei TaxID=6290 RepID=A0A0N4X3K3_HAEPC|nr:unnamed protein product [Haemonchus placei]